MILYTACDDSYPHRIYITKVSLKLKRLGCLSQKFSTQLNINRMSNQQNVQQLLHATIGKF